MLLVPFATPSKQRCAVSLQTVKEPTLRRRKKQGWGSQKRRLTGQGHGLGDDAVVRRQFSVERPRIALVGVLVGQGRNDAIKGVFRQGHDLIGVVNPSTNQAANEDSGR